MSEKKPVLTPLYAARSNCPVCGKPSYSATGMHPQCAVAQADSVIRADLKRRGETVRKVERKPWYKPCPKCKRQVAARRAVCDCGHAFASVASDKVSS